MKNGDMPAMPVFDPQAPAADFEWVTGLTKREAFAMAAMLGLISTCVDPDTIPEDAVRMADAQLAALEQEQCHK